MISLQAAMPRSSEQLSSLPEGTALQETPQVPTQKVNNAPTTAIYVRFAEESDRAAGLHPASCVLCAAAPNCYSLAREVSRTACGLDAAGTCTQALPPMAGVGSLWLMLGIMLQFLRPDG